MHEAIKFLLVGTVLTSVEDFLLGRPRFRPRLNLSSIPKNGTTILHALPMAALANRAGTSQHRPIASSARPLSFGRRSVGCIFRRRVDLVGTVEVAGGPAMNAVPARGYPVVGQFDFHDLAAVRADCIHRFLLHLS